jgi:steroid 5-alpha reductase family enzyme
VLSGLIAVVALFTALWLVSIVLKNSSIVDMWWGPGIFLIGLTYKLTANNDEQKPDGLALLVSGRSAGLQRTRNLGR